jgi:hypothetical protein
MQFVDLKKRAYNNIPDIIEVAKMGKQQNKSCHKDSINTFSIRPNFPRYEEIAKGYFSA